MGRNIGDKQWDRGVYDRRRGEEQGDKHGGVGQGVDSIPTATAAVSSSSSSSGRDPTELAAGAGRPEQEEEQVRRFGMRGLQP
ncbi:unnamed protein product [Camellia sinensis]